MKQINANDLIDLTMIFGSTGKSPIINAMNGVHQIIVMVPVTFQSHYLNPNHRFLNQWVLIIRS